MSIAIHLPAESYPDVDWLSRDSCNSYIEQRWHQFRNDVEALELVRDELLRTQKEIVIQGLCKLNKDVKLLSVKEFNDTFGCDIIEMMREMMTAGGVQWSGAGTAMAAASTAGKKHSRVIGASAGQQMLSMKTPAAHRFGRPPMTMRTARRGEVIKSFSVNGSPIDQFDHGEVVVTAKKRRGGPGGNSGMGGAGDSATSFPISFGIGAGNGETIDLSDPNQRKNLDAEQKAQAMQQLMAIQEQMNKLMADF
ncbi:hypothetical protein ACHAWU_010323 [Discostella pseudostelligera]|uniref:Uncharacterized protein n=1 Tax=Discostella pseudostelligera TaxID=259834 RepID=A0ABD3NAS9_9STRA